MPKRIIFHAGFHKTGTTSVQATLRENRPLMKQHIALRRRWHMKELMSATRGYSTWRDPLTLIKVQDRFEQVMDGVPHMPAVSYTHLRAHETKANLVCRLLLEKKK